MRVLVVEDEVRLLKQLTNRIREALAKCIKAAYPHCDIVFCTGYSDYAPQAFEPVATFTKRSKELLAYLINKEGILCPTSEICNAIFRDSSDSYLRVAKRDLKVILRDIGKADVLVSGWGVLAENVQITDANKTRFYVLSKERVAGGTNAVFAVTCEANRIDDIIVEIHDLDIELVTIHDRPEGNKPGKYNYIIEVEADGGITDAQINAISSIDKIRFFGSFDKVLK